MSKLLPREQFREQVFARSLGKCVLCGARAVDAHHIIERRLWPDGGYYLDNGAALCEGCHLDAEMTTVTVERIREVCGITKVLVPPHLYADQPYDKWGNPVLASGQRLRGELFDDISVQKILKQGGVLNLFTEWVKYPRTHHLPWSEGVNDDDRILLSMDHFMNREVVVTEKMDGENTTLYRTYLHARSVDGRSHSSRDWVKQFWAQRCGDIPDRWRICGENLYAQHSIGYVLPTYFMGFSIWNEHNECLSWDETLEWFQLLDIQPVPQLYRGWYSEWEVRQCWSAGHWATREGYVLRTVDGFSYAQFRERVAKFVRKGHIQTTKHWMHGQPVVPNKLSEAP